MRHGGRPDPNEGWDVPGTPYEAGRGGPDRGRVLPGYDAYETPSYEPAAHEPRLYQQTAYEQTGYEPTGYEAGAYESVPYDGAGYGGPAFGSPAYGAQAYGSPAYEPAGPAAGGYDAGGAEPYAVDDTPVLGVESAAPHFAGGRIAEPGMDAAEEEAYGSSWEFEEGLARLLASAPEQAPRIPRQRFAHRRQPRRLVRLLRRVRRTARLTGPVSWLKLISLTLAAMTAVVVAVVGALSGVISYDPLRRLAVPGATGALAGLWPLLVYGPWLVAAMSILRAAVHRRRAAHSWFVVVVFSAIAVYLCVAHAGRTPIRLAVAGLPPITALVCFHQLVRQITLTNPPRNGPRRPRHTARRD